MIELVATAIITISSGLLFGYWFRYTCLLILSAKTAQDFAGAFAAANRLNFARVQGELSSAQADLEALHGLLDRDYLVISSVFQNGSENMQGLEDRMLQFNYRLMSAWYEVSRHFSVSAARKALDEMSMIVAHFANSIGEREACASAA